MRSHFLRALQKGSAAPTDPNFNQVALLLHGDGTNGAQNNTFLDSSTNNFSITRNGNATQGSFSPFAPTSAYSPSVNGGSGYFDGNGDYVWVGDNSALNIGTGDFTIECWVYHTNTSTNAIYVDKPQSGIAFARLSNNKLSMIQSGVAARVTSSGTLLANTWYHVAASRSGTTTRLFINGVQDGSGTDNSNYSCANSLIVGASASTASPTPSSPTNYMVGYISNLRILKGTALYTANFTPPTAPLTDITNTSLLLNFTDAGIVDSAAKNDLETVGNAQVSTSVTKFGTGSMAFDGSGDYLVVPASSEHTFGTSPFTVEFWYYANVNSGERGVVAKGTSGLSTNWQISQVGTGEIRFFYNAITNFQTTTQLNTNTWYHVAVVGNSTSIVIYINGVQDASVTYTYNYTDNSIFRVGINRGSTQVFNGYIDDLRITNGVARYTADFTPPSAPYPDLQE